MELLVVELGDIGDPVFDAGEEVLLPCIIENVRLQDRHVDAAQQLEVGEVLQRSFADDRQYPPRRPVVDDIGEILGNAHRDAGGARRFELDDTPVDGNFRRRCGSPRQRRKGHWRTECDDDRGRDDRALHDGHRPYCASRRLS